MISIDEAIAKYKEKAEYLRTTTNVAYALEMKQLVEWLEELKDLQEMKETIECNAEVLEQQGYNNALDDFKKILTIEKIKEYAESDGFINLNNCNLMIFDIAEQLKAGRKHE